MKTWVGNAPSNIALIKYMGKIKVQGNIPTNDSLSLTLDHLRTFVQIEADDSLSEDCWAPLEKGQLRPSDEILKNQLTFNSDGLVQLQPLELSDKGQERFLNHFKRLKEAWGIDGAYRVRSGNNFPSDCGLASSASSFAALTVAAGAMANELKGLDLGQTELAGWSQKGSGSSCRSFFSPWAIWSNKGAEPVAGLPENLKHAVVIVDDQIKSVSSSEAHLRVLTSELFEGRILRAQTRLENLVKELKSDWNKAYQICWAEFWDMHALFETSQPHFGYMTPGSLEVLSTVRQFWAEKGDGPLVTMDAGANIHLIFRGDQSQLGQPLLQSLSSQFKVFSNL